MKRTISFILALVMLFALAIPVSAATAVSIWEDTPTPERKETTATVYFSSNRDIGAYQWLVRESTATAPSAADLSNALPPSNMSTYNRVQLSNLARNKAYYVYILGHEGAEFSNTLAIYVPAYDTTITKPPVTPVQPTLPVTALPFTDVKKGTALYDAVATVYNANIMFGTSDTKFSPDLSLSRAMVVTLLYRLAGRPAQRDYARYRFVDADYNSWYGDALIWGYNNGIANGVGDNKFAPDRSITRQELIALLYRYHEAYGGRLAASHTDVYITDVAKADEWARSAIYWADDLALLADITSGGKLSPKREATRGDTAFLIARYISLRQ